MAGGVCYCVWRALVKQGVIGQMRKLMNTSIAIFTFFFVQEMAVAQTREQYDTMLEQRFKEDLYFPVAMAEWNAMRCDDIKVAADMKAKLMVLATKARADMSRVEHLLMAEEDRCCLIRNNWKSWQKLPCDRVEFDKYVGSANEWFTMTEDLIQKRSAAH